MIANTYLSTQACGKIDSNKQILLIHGWGMNSGVWTDIAKSLESYYPDYLIRSVDLPGYGKSTSYPLKKLNGIYNSQSLAQSLIPLLEKKQNIIIAWSMGGLVAIELATIAEVNISQLIFVSSTPRFVQDNHWNYAVPASFFEDFYQSLLKDHQATLKRFLAIQAMGSSTARQDIKYLYTHLLKRGKANPESLQYGLKMLLKEDKRKQLSQITAIPIYLICGERDTLVHYRGQKQLAEQKNVTLHKIPGAGHAPFISHPETFKEILQLCIPAENTVQKWYYNNYNAP